MSASSALEGLDDEQRAVAQALHGPVVVLAGAGTGKTRAITHRIAHAVATGEHDPRRTLAVTFTTRAAGRCARVCAGSASRGCRCAPSTPPPCASCATSGPGSAAAEFPELLPSKARLVAEAASRCRLPTDTATVRDLAADLEWAKVNFLSGADIGQRAASVSRTLAVDAAALAQVQTAYEDAKAGPRSARLRGRPARDRGCPGRPARHRRRGPCRLSVVHRRRVPGREPAAAPAARPVAGRARRPVRRRRREPDDLHVHRCVAAVPHVLPRDLRRRHRGPAGAAAIAARRRSSVLANAVIERCHGAASVDARCVLRSQRPAGPEPTIEACSDDVDEAEQVARRVRGYLADGVPARDIAVLFRINAQSVPLRGGVRERGGLRGAARNRAVLRPARGA